MKVLAGKVAKVLLAVIFVASILGGCSVYETEKDVGGDKWTCDVFVDNEDDRVSVTIMSEEDGRAYMGWAFVNSGNMDGSTYTEEINLRDISEDGDGVSSFINYLFNVRKSTLTIKKYTSSPRERQVIVNVESVGTFNAVYEGEL